ncbi:hypothetical protein SNOG_09984 [Parastagonospora nodorum SN15]|uniref:RRM domain-containing protein n=1 Tax=Phaeosphaeria nodorum (strain SN15 / ATCC MYA-4574 / FGSC 10173) TaxID=321614 RepID=Q0UE30_PHANO|nr:hypothetical protein SNOG_09984 [Parastagonospora nodorum SN15]EAT82319.2 hypothetical protein SNOG_09984 [Parastagonospora nodorum SN15]
MEDMPMPRGGSSSGYGGDRPTFGSSGGGGFGADRGGSFGGCSSRTFSIRADMCIADRGFAMREELPLPSKPPYTAHLGNLSFDATEGDVNDFFADCEVTNVRIVEDKLDRKPKGFGYVEFGSVDGLKKALALSGTQFQGRNVRIFPASDAHLTAVLASAVAVVVTMLPPTQAATGANAAAHCAPFAGDGKERDFGNWERKGPLSPAAAAPNAMAREGRQPSFQGGAREHRQSPAWGEGREDSGSRGPRREFQPSERPPPVERAPTAADQDSQWRTKMRPDAPASASPTGTPDGSTPSSPAPAAAAPAGRPRLNLAKRTVSEAQPQAEAASSSNKPNPFGAARPIDTAAREKEIEEKKQLELRQKKEADDKAREERKAKEAEKAAAAKDAAPADKAKSPSEEKPKANFEILQRENEEGTAAGQDEDAEGEIVDDKAVKPQEVVRDPPKSAGAWRRKDDASPAAEGSTTEKLDEDGWSTVAKPKKTQGRRGGPPTRAIAS